MIKRKQVERRSERRTEPVEVETLTVVRGGVEDLIKSTSYEDNWRVQR
jgi:hypothetical protein